MIKKIWQISSLIIFVSGLALGQFSLVSAWPEPFRYLNLGVLLVTFGLFFFNLQTAIFLAISFGLWLDMLSFNFFGFYLLPLMSLTALDYWLSKNWLTNRSLYSLIVLLFINTMLYNLLVATFTYIMDIRASTFFLITRHFWLALLYQALGGLIAAILLFNLMVFLTKKIKPFFLEKKTIL